jgi:hypothetical protein
MHYEGTVDVRMFPFIWQKLESDHYDEINSTFQVIGLTSEVIIVMRTCDMDEMLHLQQINQSSLSHATTTKQLHHMKLELLCDDLNRQKILRNGNYLATDVIPQALEAEKYTWHIMQEGGAYAYDA